VDVNEFDDYATGRKNGVRFTARSGFDRFVSVRRVILVPSHSGTIRIREAISAVVKRPELEADHALLCNAEKNYPHVLVVWCFMKHG